MHSPTILVLARHTLATRIAGIQAQHAGVYDILEAPPARAIVERRRAYFGKGVAEALQAR